MPPNTILRDMLNRFIDLEDQVPQFAQTLMRDRQTNELILNLNRDQMYRGIRADGSQITPPYKPYTIQKKAGKGDPYDRVTLNDEDDFYEGLRTKVTPGKTEIFGTDWKTEMLEDKYNGSGRAVIFGLTQESIERVRTYMRPEFRSFFKFYFQ